MENLEKESGINYLINIVTKTHGENLSRVRGYQFQWKGKKMLLFQ